LGPIPDVEDGGDAASELDGGGDEGFSLGDAAPLADGPTAATGTCDPPCAASEFCYAKVFTGGRAPGDDSGSDADLDATDAGADAADAGHSIGCHALPAACAANATCACVLDALGDVCPDVLTCNTDAGAPVVTCTRNLP
jgi:hypothetical protein